MERSTRAKRAEFVFASFFVLLGLFVLYDAFTLEESGIYSVVSPKTFEYIIGTFATLVGIALLIEIARGKYGIPEGTDENSEFLPPDIKTMSIIIGAMGAHIFLIERIGYIAAASITFYGVAFAFGSRKILKDILISFLFAIIVYITFSKGLRIFLPEGFFEDLFNLSRQQVQ
jgi:putative tricarboxylic transport membrane protein